MTEFNQTPVLFGPARSLMGMITLPTHQEPAPVACLLLNMGANHRVGPHRINVKLAHALATRGISNIRFDLGGLGDSAPPTNAGHYLTQAVSDVQAAMDLMQQKLGIRQFLIAGLCSGAVNALATAVADARVVGVSMFDSYAFPNLRSRWERAFWRALAAPANPAFLGKARRGLQRKLARLGSRLGPFRLGTSKAAGTISSDAPLNILDEVISPAGVAAIFRDSMTQLANRNVSVHMLFSGSLHVRDRNRDQLGVFRRESFTQDVHYEFIREIDHTLTTLVAQQLFVKSISDWGLAVIAERAVPAASSAASTAPGQASGTARSAMTAMTAMTAMSAVAAVAAMPAPHAVPSPPLCAGTDARLSTAAS